MHTASLIITDDDPTIVKLITEVAESIGYEVSSATNGKQLLTAITEAPPNVIILDLVMPDMDGIETLRELAKRECTSALIFITGFQQGYLDTANLIGSARGLNIIGSLNKPFSLDSLNDILQTAYPS